MIPAATMQMQALQTTAIFLRTEQHHSVQTANILSVLSQFLNSPSQHARHKIDTKRTEKCPEAIQRNNERPDHGAHVWGQSLFKSGAPAAVDEAQDELHGKSVGLVVFVILFYFSICMFTHQSTDSLGGSPVSHR